MGSYSDLEDSLQENFAQGTCERPRREAHVHWKMCFFCVYPLKITMVWADQLHTLNINLLPIYLKNFIHFLPREDVYSRSKCLYQPPFLKNSYPPKLTQVAPTFFFFFLLKVLFIFNRGRTYIKLTSLTFSSVQFSSVKSTYPTLPCRSDD